MILYLDWYTSVCSKILKQMDYLFIIHKKINQSYFIFHSIPMICIHLKSIGQSNFIDDSTDVIYMIDNISKVVLETINEFLDSIANINITAAMKVTEKICIE